MVHQRLCSPLLLSAVAGLLGLWMFEGLQHRVELRLLRLDLLIRDMRDSRKGRPEGLFGALGFFVLEHIRFPGLEFSFTASDEHVGFN